MGKRNFTLNHTEEELVDWQKYLTQCIKYRTESTALAQNTQALAQNIPALAQNTSVQLTLKQLCKKTEKEIITINILNKNKYKELKNCTNIEIFFKGYKELQSNQNKIEKLLAYLGNPSMALFLNDKTFIELINNFLRRTSQLSENKNIWFSQVSHYFSEMTEAQIALSCSLAQIFENN